VARAVVKGLMLDLNATMHRDNSGKFYRNLHS